MSRRYHLAQLNISRLKAPLDHPSMKEFVDFLDPVNRYAEESPGFVWRMKGENGEASSFLASPFGDPMIVSNLTVWTDMESLRRFVHHSVHRYFLQSRGKWFERSEDAQVVIWWVPEGHIPTMDEAKGKLEQLRSNGPTPQAFSFQAVFNHDGGPLTDKPS